MASLATALELTRYPGWQEHYQLTIYQLGWRLGGKCATGRGVHGRIEEHGIHIMQGWYHNTFRLMEEVYEERLRHGLAPRARYPRFADALEPDNGTLMPEYCRQHHRWETYPLNFPPNEEVPGQGGPLSPWQNLHKLMSLGVELAAGLVYDRSRDPVRTAIHEHVAPRERVERILSRLRRALGSTRDDAGSFRSLARMLSAVSRALAVLAERQDECAVVRKLLTRVNLFRAMLDGLLRDVYVPRTGAFNFEAINHLDYRAWLALHGASREALDTSIVRFSYTGMFANLADGAGGGGLVSAGSALRVVLLAAGYKRAFVSKFRAGTGDTLVMPIYDVLAHRGVRFEFFQDVRAVHASDTGEIERVTVDRQVTLKGEAYDPAVVVRGVRAWPAQPRYEQIDNEQATALRRDAIDLESPWARWKPVETRTLEKGKHFDQVILGIPIEPLKSICAEILERDERWRAMVAHIRTVQTPCVQLWTRPTMAQLGMVPTAWGLRAGTEPQTVVYASPLVSWIEMTSVMRAHEAWEGSGRVPGALVYFTGAVADAEPLPSREDHDFPRREGERVLRLTEGYLRHAMGYFWPGGTSRETPCGFDPALLFHPDGDDRRPDDDMLRAQLVRANADPSSRYTLSVPGSGRYRLRTDESGYRNLYLAGDWTDFGVNVGYVEGAVISGTLAAQALRKAHGLGGHRSVFVDVPEAAPWGA